MEFMICNSYKTFKTAYANDFAALKPEWWALESLAVLEESLVVANLVNRDYNDAFQAAGDTVHVNKPGTFVSRHKVQGSNVITQDASATDTLVKLNQHLHVSVVLDDREIQQSLPDLRNYVLAPQLRAMAEGIDAAIVGEAVQFAETNSAGTLGTALSAASVIELGRVFDANNVPGADRILVTGPAGKADLLNVDRFSDADKRGDRSALLNGEIGDIMGFNVFMSQTVGAQLTNGVTTSAETVNDADGEPPGTTSITIDAATAAHTAGTWCTIAGVPGVYRLASAIAQTTGTEAVLTQGIRGTAADGVAITFYEAATALTDGTAAIGEIAVVTDGYTSAAEIPQVGQGLSFGASATAPVYTVARVDGTYADNTTDITLTLNRPLDVALTDGLAINVMPSGVTAGGGYNMAFRPDAITLVNRPLAPPVTSVASSTQNNGAFSVRVTLAYDELLMKHRITVDTLMGVKLLDVNQGAVLFN
jgi:N4-gp56 family major capsid protein